MVLEIVFAMAGALVGVTFLSFSMEGYLFRELSWIKRGAFLIGGLLILVPDAVSDIAGLALTLPILIVEWRSRRLSRAQNLAVPAAIQG